MYEFKHEQDVFVKAEQVKALIKTCFGEHLTNNDIQKCLARIWHNRYHNTAITEFDMQVRELLEKHNIDPKTAYNWIRATQLPEDVKSLIESRKISPTKAFEVISNRQRREKAAIGLQILEKGRALIWRL